MAETIMTMQETEDDILTDLMELADPISQYTFILSCAQECRQFDEALRRDEYLVKDCQVNTWLYAEITDGVLRFETDSESLIVKGALALMQEIYDGRSVEEISAYRCRLLEHDEFARHFATDQFKGLSGIVLRLSNMD